MLKCSTSDADIQLRVLKSAQPASRTRTVTQDCSVGHECLNFLQKVCRVNHAVQG